MADKRPDLGEVSDGYHTFNELYEHRHALFALLLRYHRADAFKTWRTADGRTTPGWFIAGINTALGQITYHLPSRYWLYLADLRVVETNADYDGHTSPDVVKRLWMLALRGTIFEDSILADLARDPDPE